MSKSPLRKKVLMSSITDYRDFIMDINDLMKSLIQEPVVFSDI